MTDSPERQTTTDNSGALVRVGSRVRILQIPASITETLSQLDTERVLSMLGEVFEVYEIDEREQAWVEKWWREGEDFSDSHSIGLEPPQMLLVDHNGA